MATNFWKIRSRLSIAVAAVVMVMGVPIDGINSAMTGIDDAEAQVCQPNDPDPYCPQPEPNTIVCVSGVCFDTRDLDDVWEGIVDFFDGSDCNPPACHPGPTPKPKDQCHSPGCAKKQN